MSGQSDGRGDEVGITAALPSGDETGPSLAEPQASSSEAPSADAAGPGSGTGREAGASDRDPGGLPAMAAAASPPEGTPRGPRPGVAATLVELAAAGEAVVSWIGEDGYPQSVYRPVDVDLEKGLARFTKPPGFRIPAGSRVAFTVSHFHPLPDGGFDGRRHATVWGTLAARPRGHFVATVDQAWAWDGEALPLPMAYERGLPRARAYYERLSAERGVRVRPRLSWALLLMRATRAPFLSASLVPVLLGLAIAARNGFFDPLTALLTILAAALAHLGLNVANDVFDTMLGADDANATPTKFSGGSRVVLNALLTLREISILSLACYLAAGVLGLILILISGSAALIAIIVVGLVISLGYTMPPAKLVYRGLGEIATAIGFGPLMLLGAYVVQSRGSITAEAVIVALPVGLLVAMILYVNEIPDRAGDAKAGKRTLPVRWSKAATIRGFDISAGASFAIVGAGVAVGILPIPTLLCLLAAPLAIETHRGLERFYDQPYALMPSMATNIRLHLAVGLLLLTGYLLTILDQIALGRTPFLS